MATETILNANDGTLDDFICKLARECSLDWYSDDWGGIFGIYFSDDETFTEEEATKIFRKAITPRVEA